MRYYYKIDNFTITLTIIIIRVKAIFKFLPMLQAVFPKPLFVNWRA